MRPTDFVFWQDVSISISFDDAINVDTIHLVVCFIRTASYKEPVFTSYHTSIAYYSPLLWIHPQD